MTMMMLISVIILMIYNSSGMMAHGYKPLNMERMLSRTGDSGRVMSIDHSDLSKGVFATAIAANIPLKIQNGCSDQKAQNIWTEEFFRSELKHAEVDVDLSATPAFPLFGNDRESAVMNFSTLLDCMNKEGIFRGRDVHCALHYADMASAPYLYTLRHDTKPLDMMKALGGVNMHLDRHLIWMGGSEQTYENYFLDFSQVLCVVNGDLEVTLHDTSQTDRLYPKHAKLDENAVSGIEGIHASVDIDNPDLELHPLYKDARSLYTHVQEGDVLFIPSQWWRRIRSGFEPYWAHVYQYYGNMAVNNMFHVYPWQDAMLDAADNDADTPKQPHRSGSTERKSTNTVLKDVKLAMEHEEL